MSELSFCLEAAALHDEDSSALTDAIERYVHAGMPMRRAQLAAIADVMADVRAEREQIHAAVREQHPGVVEAAEKARQEALKPAAQPEPEKPEPAVASRGPGVLLHGSRLPGVLDAVHHLTRGWERSPDVHVIESMEHAPAPVRDAFEQQNSHGASGLIDGFHYRGKVYLVADALHTQDDVQRVLYHESLGHFGLRGVFGKSLDAVLDATAATLPHDLQRKAQEYGLDLADPAQRRTAAEELLAEIAQDRPELGVVQRAVAAIRTFLREHGIDSLKMSRDEIIRDFILPARGFVEHGKQPADEPTFFGRGKPQFSRHDEEQPFYSALSREVEGIPAKAQGGDGWRAQVQGLIAKGKVKADEVEWSGLNDWLHAQTGKVSKDAVLNFLDQHGVQVHEVIHGAPSMQEVHEKYTSVMQRHSATKGEADRMFLEMLRFATDQKHDQALKDRGFDLLDGTVTGNEIHDAVTAGKGGADGTSYKAYKLEGGSGYRELLLTLPAEGRFSARTGGRADMPGNPFDGVEFADNKVGVYQSNHFNEPNILAHVRFDTRRDAEGRRVLMVQEIQSDWAQEGRKRGFSDQEDPRIAPLREKRARLLDELEALPTGNDHKFDLMNQITDVNAELQSLGARPLSRDVVQGHVARAPFVEKTDAWLHLALKRIVKYAADNGFDRVAFVNGEQSADRYDLSKSVKRVAYGDGTLAATDHSDRVVLHKQVPESEIADYIGKDAAEKLLAQPANAEGARVIQGDGLKVGGEGMKAFYDKIVPAAANKVLAKLGGGKVGTVQMPQKITDYERTSRWVGPQRTIEDVRTLLEVAKRGGRDILENPITGRQEPFAINRVSVEGDLRHILKDMEAGKSFEEAMVSPDVAGHASVLFGGHIESFNAGHDMLAQPGFDITPAMREKTADGVPMFSRTGTTPATEGMPRTAPDSRWERSKSVLSDLIDEGLSRSGIYRAAAPMSEGSVRARAVAQNFANAERLARAQWNRIAEILQQRFTPEQRRQMWEAADEQNTMLQQGQATAGRGLDRLSAQQRDAVEQLHVYGEELLRRAKAVGMFEGEGLPYWTPRMMVMIDGNGEYARPGPEPGKKQTSGGDGRNVFTSSSNLKQRKYLTAAETEAAMQSKGGELVRDIMTMPLAMQRLERAIAGRELINQIKDLGRATGEPTVMNGRPDHDGWFTLDHASFTTFVPKKVPVRMSEYFDKKLIEGLTELADNLGVRHERKGALKGGSLGLAYRDKPLVQTKLFTPDQVLTHEIGHQIDFKYHLADQLARRGGTAKELRALADLRFEGQEDEVTDAYKAYVRKGTEKIANLVHAYVHNPERFRQVAPETFNWFDHFVRFTPELEPLKDLGPSLTIGSREVEGKITQWEQKPLYMRKEFEGPIKAILSNQDGTLYRAYMLLKSKAMSAIMFSPLIHNLVIFGRALGYDPTMAGTVGLYVRGHAARQDNELVRTAIGAGMVPMGYHRQGMQDITDVARGFGKEGGLLDPAESWVAHGARAIVGAVNKDAGEAAKRFVDKAGDFWHGTLLWDRVADLQMGIFDHANQRLQAKGFEPGVANTMAAHWANRYAGAVARENMGEYARKAANVLLFSRSFNMGNLGTVKDLVYGMPSGLRAKIEAEYGRASASKAFTEARRKAWAGFIADAAMSLIALSVAQSAVDRLRKDESWDEIFGGYADRARAMWENIKAHPASAKAYSPWQLSPTHDNEPGKQDRVDMGQLPDAGGRHEYMRLPTGKVVEDLFNWTTHFPTTFEAKSSPLAKSVWTALANDKGFGVPVYDPNGSVSAGALDVAKHLAKSETPWDTIVTAWDKLHGKTSAIENDKLVGNATGFTYSQGHPQGPEAGVAAEVEDRIKAQKLMAMEEVKRLLKYDHEDQAREKLEAIGLSPREVTQMIKHIQEPSEGMTREQRKRFGQHGTEEDQERMDRVTK